MITRDDYDWWLTTASELEWTWAKTYADTAPHDYIVQGRRGSPGPEDFERAARVIYTFGQPGKYYGVTNIYLEDARAGVKWWTMDADVTKTTLINRATTTRLYGAQNAPSTLSGIATEYDAVATDYDVDHPMPESVAAAVREAVHDARGDYMPAVLDVACGTGRALDLGLTTPDRHAGVDPSAPMLNQLVRKHPTVARVYPTTIESALADGRFTPRQFEIVTLMVDEADSFADATVAAIEELASRAFIHVRGDSVAVRRA
jgi:predicted TPR repeat methyltransferase